MSSQHDSATPGPPARGPSERFHMPESRGDAPAFVVLGILAVLVCLGLMFESPGLFFVFEAPGILVVLLILATPALIRTVVASSRQRAAGAPQSGPAALGTFLSSLGVVAMIGVASVAAFYATCFAVCLGVLQLNDLNHGKSYEWIVVASVGAGLVPGLWIAVRLFRRLWSRKGRA